MPCKTQCAVEVSGTAKCHSATIIMGNFHATNCANVVCVLEHCESKQDNIVHNVILYTIYECTLCNIVHNVTVYTR